MMVTIGAIVVALTRQKGQDAIFSSGQPAGRPRLDARTAHPRSPESMSASRCVDFRLFLGSFVRYVL